MTTHTDTQASTRGQYGISCFNHDDCRSDIDQCDGETYDEFQDRAGREGWVIGHVDGQGSFACPTCTGMLWEPMPVCALSSVGEAD